MVPLLLMISTADMLVYMHSGNKIAVVAAVLTALTALFVALTEK